MRTLLLTLSLTALAFASGCRSHDNDGAPIQDATTGESLYTQVGMHFDVKSGRYVAHSTNHIRLNKFVPAGTHLTYQGTLKERLLLTDDNGSEYLIEFEPKHSLMTLPDWKAQQFGAAPPMLPEDLTDAERQAIANGEIVVGMSRAAMFLAVGYPPKSLNPSLQDRVLKYQLRRLPPLHLDVRFGDDDRVVSIDR